MGEGKMHGTRDAISKIVEWRDKTEELGKNWANRNGKNDIPDQKLIYCGFGGRAIFPSNI